MTIIAILGIAQTLVILTAGIDLSVGVIMILCLVVMGRTCVVYGVPVAIAFAARAVRRPALRRGQRADRHLAPPAAVHRHARHLEHFRRAQHLVFAQRDDPRSRTSRRSRRSCSGPAQSSSPTICVNIMGLDLPFLKGSVVTYGSMLMMRARGVHLVRAARAPPSAGTSTPPATIPMPRASPGINTNRTLIAVYTRSPGSSARIAAWVLIGRIGGVSPQAGQTANLDSITAVVIGGTSLFGGRGSIVGTLFGALIVGVFRNGLALSGLDAPLAGFHGRRADHRRGHHRPVDQEGFVMTLPM